MGLVSLAALALTAQFAAMSGPGWTGGDAAWSARLPGNRTAWLFGDTLLGGRLAARNGMVVEERNGTMRTLVGQASTQDRSLVPGHGSGDWYWPGPPVVGRRTLQVPMAHVARTGPGAWDFKATGTAIAEFALPSLRLRSVTPVATPPRVNMASAAVTAGRFTYVYGTGDSRPAGKDTFVARVGARNLRGRWTYWTGRRWSADPSTATPVAHGVSDQFSVVRAGRRWALVTQVPLTRDIVEFAGPSPRGPWRRVGRIARIPGIPNAITYNATVHPEYSRPGRVVVGYCVMPDALTESALYRPRFMAVDL